MRVFFCIFIKIITRGSASSFGSLHFRKAVFLLSALSPSLPVSPDVHDFICRFVYYIYIITICFFCAIFAAEKISRNTFCFFRILLRIIEDYLRIFCSE